MHPQSRVSGTAWPLPGSCSGLSPRQPPLSPTAPLPSRLGARVPAQPRGVGSPGGSGPQPYRCEGSPAGQGAGLTPLTPCRRGQGVAPVSRRPELHAAARPAPPRVAGEAPPPPRRGPAPLRRAAPGPAPLRSARCGPAPSPLAPARWCCRAPPPRLRAPPASQHECEEGGEHLGAAGGGQLHRR